MIDAREMLSKWVEGAVDSVTVAGFTWQYHRTKGTMTGHY